MFDAALEGLGKIAVGLTSGVLIAFLAGYWHYRRVVVSTRPALIDAEGRQKATTTAFLIDLLARADKRIADLEARYERDMAIERKRCDLRFQAFAAAMGLPAHEMAKIELELGEPVV